jgi:hypothetical protein
MDLVAVGDDGIGFHANWSGWSFLCTLLDALECNVSELAGSNDGDLVSADNAEAFGREVLAHIDEIHVLHISSDVSTFDRDIPVLARGDTIAEVSGHYGVEVSCLRDIPDFYEFVERFGRFCLGSGGFRQF